MPENTPLNCQECLHFKVRLDAVFEAEVDGKKLLLGNNDWLVDQGVVTDSL